MNIILDTNVLVSAIQFGGKPRAVLELVIDQEITGFLTLEIIRETRETLWRKFQVSRTELKQIEDFLQTVFIVVAIKPIPKTARDPKDDHVLAIVEGVKIDLIVSGDNDLLVLKEYRDVPIVTPHVFLRQHHFDTAEEKLFP